MKYHQWKSAVLLGRTPDGEEEVFFNVCPICGWNNEEDAQECVKCGFVEIDLEEPGCSK